MFTTGSFEDTERQLDHPSKTAPSVSRRFGRFMACAAAVVVVAAASQSYAAVVTTLQLTSADPLAVPVLSYDATLGITSVTGSFTLTGQNGVTLGAGETGPATLTLTGFDPQGAAFTGIPGLIIQNLITPSHSATFTIKDALNNILLSGTTTDAELSLSTGASASGSLFNINNVVYDPTPIYSDFVAAGYVNPGSFSFALTAFDAGDPSVTGSTLNNFTANVGGAYAATPVPEPASLAVLGLAGAALFTRRRRS